MERLNRRQRDDLSIVSRSTFTMLYNCLVWPVYGQQDYKSVLCQWIDSEYIRGRHRPNVYPEILCKEAIAEIQTLSNRACRVLHSAFNLAQNDRTPDLTRDDEINKWYLYMLEADPATFSAPVMLFDIQSWGLASCYEKMILDVIY